jgi:predicted ATP-dependent endonuclease of OLD family
MKLKSVSIKNLYGQYDFQWDLSSDVNILSGNNGSYKSTILKVIFALCSLKYPESYFQIGSAELLFEDGTLVKYRNFNDSLSRLKEEAEHDEMLTALAETVKNDIQKEDEKQITEHVVNANIIDVRRGNERIPRSVFKESCIFNLVSTFDVPIDKDKADVSTLVNKSNLDSQLATLESDYAYYLSDLSKQLTNLIMKRENFQRDDMKGIYADNDRFIALVDECFKCTGKSVDRESSRLQFQFENKTKLDSLTHLSSGEKQMLVILLTVLLQDHRESILLMDEPEISMHLDWQLELLNYIHKLNPNCQVLLTTHSPGIILGGWQSRVKEMTHLLNSQIKTDKE